MMKKYLTIFCVLFLLDSACVSAQLPKVWSSDRIFESPESVIYDSVRRLIYVSNINGKSDARDGNGFISILTIDGKLKNREWIKGLDAPKGMAIIDDHLYIADLDSLVKVDIAKGTIEKKVFVPGAVFLNDVAASKKHGVFISDSRSAKIYHVADGNAQLWMTGDQLERVNGLYIEADTLYAGSHHIHKIEIPSRRIINLADSCAGIDGLVKFRNGFLYSNWVGRIYYFSSGVKHKLVDIASYQINTADIFLAGKENLLLVPTFSDGRVIAYHIDEGILEHAYGQDQPRLVSHKSFKSKWVQSRNVDVLLPTNYNVGKKYPVIYMHDGQNLFNTGNSFGGNEWGVDEITDSLARCGVIDDVIVVGIWNTANRYAEYMPAKPAKKVKRALAGKVDNQRFGNLTRLDSDSYLRFIVTELKPFIDSTYSTNPRRASTFIMGSSMGGLVSMYALLEYPATFGGAACLSTHWPALGGLAVHYFKKYVTRARGRLYFDRGTIGLDASYSEFQGEVDGYARRVFRGPKQFKSLIFNGADHNENSWRQRLDIPLRFLLEHPN